jgi:hypothetical protein
VNASVHGDPASCSQVGGSLRRLASQLRAAGSQVQATQADLVDEWSGRVARTVGRGTTTVGEATTAVAAELDRTGALLQDHATDLAEALQEVRALEQRAGAVGLSVVDGRVTPRWGVSGVADHDALAAREARRSELQSELDRVALHLARRRARLTAALEAATALLADHSSLLRE